MLYEVITGQRVGAEEREHADQQRRHRDERPEQQRIGLAVQVVAVRDVASYNFV